MNEPTRITLSEIKLFARGARGSAQNFFRLSFWHLRAASLGKKHPEFNMTFEEVVVRATLDARRLVHDPAFVPRLAH